MRVHFPSRASASPTSFFAGITVRSPLGGATHCSWLGKNVDCADEEVVSSPVVQSHTEYLGWQADPGLGFSLIPYFGQVPCAINYMHVFPADQSFT